MASAAQAAAHIDLSRVAFVELIAKGIITKPAKQGGYDLDNVRVSYIRHVRKVASGRAGGSGGDQLTAQRVRLAAEQADAVAMKNAITRREWGHLPTIVRYLETMLLSMRDQLLGLPGETAFALAMRTQEECFQVLDDAIRSKLEELSDPNTPMRAAAAGVDGAGPDAADDGAPQ